MVMIPRTTFQTGALAGQAYKNVSAQTATPGQMLLMLYDGAIRFAKQAKEAIETGDPAAKGRYINKVMAIIDEFIAALDHESAPEFCANIEQLYLYLNDRLSYANSRMDVDALDEVIDHLAKLRESWGQAVATVGG